MAMLVQIQNTRNDRRDAQSYSSQAGQRFSVENRFGSAFFARKPLKTALKHAD